jgi:hypothetical protein
MIAQVAAASGRTHYKPASTLVKPLLQSSPDDPWVKLHLGQLQEASGKSEAAEQIYLTLLKGAENPKVALQARRGLDRLEAAAEEKRQAAIAQAQSDPTNAGTGFLILEAITGEERAIAAKNLAKILKLDVYSAQFQLPSRGWRLYRTGSYAEIQVYARELQQAGLNVFCGSLSTIKAINVFKVDYMQSINGQPTVVCRNDAGQVGSLTFDWGEVAQGVRGRLPIFEQVIDLDAFKRLKRKEQTQDYTQVYDLHLPGRQSILRFCDRTYQFQKGVSPSTGASSTLSKSQSSIRIQWNQLIARLTQQMGDRPLWEDFNTFAQTAFDHLDLLENFDTHIEIFRKEPTTWDPAFHLYSGLVFIR